MMFIGHDPDVGSPATAWFDQGPDPVQWRVSVNKATSLEEACRVAHLQANLVIAAWEHRGKPEALAAVESQQIYGRMQAEDPNDLLKIAKVAGAFLGPLMAAGIPAFFALPSDWKDSVKKHIHQARILDREGVPHKQMGGGRPYTVPTEIPKGWSCAVPMWSDWKHAVDALGLARHAENEHRRKALLEKYS